MKISFFEEFPSDINLEKLKLINFNSTISIAAKSIKNYKTIINRAKLFNDKVEFVYWPILVNSYWISPFSVTSDLENLLKDLKENHKFCNKLMLDFEYPFLNKKLFLINFLRFYKNKKIIEEILSFARLQHTQIFTAEYILPTGVLNLMGLSYNNKKYHHKKIFMYYSSLFKFQLIEKAVKYIIYRNKLHLKNNIIVGLGTIAFGIFGNEPILPLKKFDSDLSYFHDIGINEIVIFRLGGLNSDYINILNNYINK